MGEAASRAARTVDDLYRSHAGEVYRFAYAMLGNKSDAEDVTQTTFVNALRSLERGERPRKPSSWLVTIAHNIVRQRWRQQQARPTEVELDLDVALEEPEQEGPSLDELVRALQRIPNAQREALVMRELEGRSYKEIEAMLEITPAALETLLFRARRSLAEELENVVTCEQAELAISKQFDGRLSRKERRRLDEHLRDCPDCARLRAGRTKHRRAFGALSLLPLPFSFTFFRDAPSASAASGLSTIGAGSVTAGSVTAAAGVTAASCVSSCVSGGLFAGGVAAKAVAVVAAASVAGSVGYKSAEHRSEAKDRAPTVQAVAMPKPPRLAVMPVAPKAPARHAVAAAHTTSSHGSQRAQAPTSVPRHVSKPAPYVLTVATGKPAQTADPAKETTNLVWEIDPIATTAPSQPAAAHVLPPPTPAHSQASPPPATPAPPASTPATPTPPADTTPPATTPTETTPPATTPPADTTPPATTPTEPPPPTDTTPAEPTPPATEPGAGASGTPTEPVTPPADPAPAPPDPAPATSEPATAAEPVVLSVG